MWTKVRKWASTAADIARNALSLSLDIAEWYLHLLIRTAAVVVVGAGLLLIAALLAYLCEVNYAFWLEAFLWWLGVTLPILAIVAFPPIWAGQQFYRRFPSTERAFKAVASVVFWSMTIPLLCLRPEVRDRPEVIIAVTGLALLLSLGSYAGIIWWPRFFSRSLLGAQLILTFLLGVVSIKFPSTALAIEHLFGSADVQWSGRLATPIRELVLNDPDRLPPFVNAAGSPLLFGAKDDRGLWHVASQPGYLASGLALHPVILQSERDQIIEQAKNLGEKEAAAARVIRAQDEQRARLAAEAAAAAAKAEQQRLEQQREAQRQAMEVNFRSAHVIASSMPRSSSASRYGVMVLGTDGHVDGEVSEEIVDVLTSPKHRASAAVLRPICADDGTFNQLFEADANEIERLQLANSAENLVMGKTVMLKKGPFEDGVNSVSVTVTMREVSLRTKQVTNTVTFQAEGMASDRDAADREARVALLKKIKEYNWKSLDAAIGH